MFPHVVEKTLVDTYDDIIEALDEYNDYVFVDARGGASPLNQKVLASSDVLVVYLNQNLGTIETYFTRFRLQSARVLTLFSDYDRDSKVSLKNMRKRHKTLKSANSAVIPHCTGFSDAMNEGKLLHWMDINKGCEEKDANHAFINEVRIASRKIGALGRTPKGGVGA